MKFRLSALLPSCFRSKPQQEKDSAPAQAQVDSPVLMVKTVSRITAEHMLQGFESLPARRDAVSEAFEDVGGTSHDSVRVRGQAAAGQEHFVVLRSPTSVRRLQAWTASSSTSCLSMWRCL